MRVRMHMEVTVYFVGVAPEKTTKILYFCKFHTFTPVLRTHDSWLFTHLYACNIPLCICMCVCADGQIYIYVCVYTHVDVDVFRVTCTVPSAILAHVSKLYAPVWRLATSVHSIATVHHYELLHDMLLVLTIKSVVDASRRKLAALRRLSWKSDIPDVRGFVFLTPSKFHIEGFRLLFHNGSYQPPSTGKEQTKTSIPLQNKEKTQTLHTPKHPKRMASLSLHPRPRGCLPARPGFPARLKRFAREVGLSI